MGSRAAGVASERAAAPAAVVAMAICSLGAAVIHAATTKTGFDLSALDGAFFVAVAAGQAGWAVLVVMRPVRAVLMLGAAGNAGVLAVWAVSRTAGVPIGPEAGVRLPVGFPDAVTAALEAILVLAASFTW